MTRKYGQGPTKRGDRIEANIPFSGFYDSKWSDMVDHAEEVEVENNDDRQEEKGVPPELRLSADEYSDILFKHAEYHKAYETIAHDYVECFAIKASGDLGFKLTLQWSIMTSPREYNFATDRLFATLSKTAVKRLMVISRRNKHVELEKVIKERFTSYDGFHSSYSNDLATWLDVPLEDWDENEIGTLLCAAIQAKIDPNCSRDKDYEWSIYEGMSEHDYEYFSDCVDWAKVDSDVADLRAEKVNSDILLLNTKPRI